MLLELFTSEGCSSCPPADALLEQLSGRTTPSGQLLVALSEHVTYWNRLGWSDQFSSDRFTDRQGSYSRRFGLEGVYTPQLVVNGEVQVVGSDRREVEAAIASQRRHATPAIHLLQARRSDRGIEIAFTVAPEAANGDDLYAVVADDLDRSEVLRGENGGRTLSHVAVARSLTRLRRKEVDAGPQTVFLPLPPNAQSAQHVVLFLQAHDQGPVRSIASLPIEVTQSLSPSGPTSISRR